MLVKNVVYEADYYIKKLFDLGAQGGLESVVRCCDPFGTCKKEMMHFMFNKNASNYGFSIIYLLRMHK
jgi:hypothetical protein